MPPKSKRTHIKTNEYEESMYTAQGGKVVVSVVYIEDKICTIVAYIDEQNASLYKAEGGTENIIDKNATPDIEE